MSGLPESGGSGQASDWGIFDKDGKIICTFDSFNGVESKPDAGITQKPVENGGFISINKEKSPDETRVRVTRGGEQSELGDTLGSLDVAVNSLGLYSIVTPSKIFFNCNLIGYDHSLMVSDGAGMLKLTLRFLEVRQVSPQYTTAKPITSPKNTETKSGKDRGRQQGKVIDSSKEDTPQKRRSKLGALFH